MGCHHELIRICPAFGGDRNCLSTPDELCPTAAKTLPSPKGAFARSSIWLSIPAFHRLHSNAIVDPDAPAFEGPTKGRVAVMLEIEVTRNIEPE
jgi:hypothetical protein